MYSYLLNTLFKYGNAYRNRNLQSDHFRYIFGLTINRVEPERNRHDQCHEFCENIASKYFFDHTCWLLAIPNLSVESSSSIFFNPFSSMSRFNAPLNPVEIVPVSSDTIITIASVSSVSPIPALWRVPRLFDSSVFSVSGSKQPAAIIFCS